MLSSLPSSNPSAVVKTVTRAPSGAFRIEVVVMNLSNKGKAYLDVSSLAKATYITTTIPVGRERDTIIVTVSELPDVKPGETLPVFIAT
ncbi:MAG: hypothetical protein WB586_06880 [Chthoniobacterales bacterium]